MPRMAPLMADKNDERILRDMNKEFGHAEYGAHVPFFFSRYGSPVDIIGAYHGATCFLVSNGPSLMDVDLELLKRPGIMVMTLNNGPSTLLSYGITPNFWVSVDQPSRFVKQIWLNPGVAKFIPTSSFNKPLWDNEPESWGPLLKEDERGRKTQMYPNDCPNVIGYKRNEKFAKHRFFTESSFNWGCHKKHGGCRTVLLPGIRIPYMLGFRRLYMLGVDLKMTEDSKYHFNEGRTKGACKGNTNTYNRIISEYGPGVKEFADKAGYEIYNCNPDSGLKCFEFRDFEETIEELTEQYALHKGEVSTEGMYLEWSKKEGLTYEQARDKVGL